MSVITFTLILLAAALYAAALAVCLFTADAGESNRHTRVVLGLGVLVQLASFIVMAAAHRFPADYEVMNSLSKEFFMAAIVFFGMKRHESRMPTALGIGVALFFLLSRIYLSNNLALQDQMAHAFSAATVLFYHCSSLAFAFFGYCFCLSVSWLANPASGAPGGVKQSGMIYKSALWGFVVFSFCQLLGSAWAFTSGWGDVWVWASSHMISAIFWIFYAGLLHVPSASKMPEKTIAVMGTAGFSAYIIWVFYYDIAIYPAYKVFMASL
jgi:hypothetical protein